MIICKNLMIVDSYLSLIWLCHVSVVCVIGGSGGGEGGGGDSSLFHKILKNLILLV